jgi:hypothetical protein
MAEIEAYDEIAKKIVERAIDEFIYEGKSLREWINMVNQIPKWIPVTDPLKELPKDRMLLVTVETKYSHRYVTELYYDMTEWSDIDAAKGAIAYRDWSYPEPYKEIEE